MIRTRLFTTRLGLALILVLIMSASAYAFAASNEVPETGAGDGNDAISGYTITGVTYGLTSGNPTTIDTVGFDIAPTESTLTTDPSDVQIRLTSTGTWISCDPGTLTDWTCPVSGAVTVLAADKLQVVAVQ